MSRTGPLNVVPEDQPLWLDDLLSEPETPINKGHRRSASDSFATLDSVSGEELLWVRSNFIGKPPGFEFAQPQSNNPWKSSSITCQPLADAPVSREKEAESKKLPRSYSMIEPKGKMLGGSEIQKHGDNAAYTSEISSGGNECSQSKPSSSAVSSAAKTEVKRKQNNARRSRLRKLQYIAELERSVQALQLQGVEASAQIEFLGQQNQLLGMENRALKQCLESLSQQHLIKSLEQERLGTEFGKLQYMYRMQQQQAMHPAVHRRSKSHDLDSQFSSLSLNPPQEVLTNNNGFRNFSP